MAKVYNAVKILPKIDDRQTTDRQTDGRAIAYSEREREFTFAKNSENSSQNKFYLPADELNFTADKTNVSTFCRNRRPAPLALCRKPYSRSYVNRLEHSPEISKHNEHTRHSHLSPSSLACCCPSAQQLNCDWTALLPASEF